MKTFELTGEVRSTSGKKAAKEARKAGNVPCNLYGEGLSVKFSVTKEAVRKLIYTPDTLIVDLSVGSTKTMAIVKELQFHPLTEELLHIDFLAVSEKKPVTVEIPVQLVGHAEGVKAGGKLSLEMRKLKVNGIYTQFPDRIEVDVTNLGLGKRLAVSEISIEGLKMMNPQEACIAQVRATRASKDAAAG